MTQPTAPVTTISWLTTPIAEQDQFPVDAVGNAGGGKIFAGAFVGENASTGYQRQFVAGDVFVGVANRSVDNSGNGAILAPVSAGEIGDGTAGSISVPCTTEGYCVYRGTIAGLAGTVADQNTILYCLDGQTLTTASGGGAAKVGGVVRYSVALQGWILKIRSGIEANLSS